MKKIILLPITLLILIFLSACYNSGNANTSNKDEIVINVKNNTNFEMYIIELSWYQNGELKGTQGNMNADGSKVKKGESFVFGLIDSDLNLKEKALFKVAVLYDKNSNEKINITNKVPFELVKGAEYQFELSGSTKDNLKLKIIDR
ncbi:hypothetical protein D1B31_01295 [Neobacillus notoginsengisoli]|uniref:Lipoprotein n=1 Tax=Neobacillus notoginsengisoli TaxID=1578198 RepID=A0A417YZL3_9BACI|nr:hypothetical protein [Neobacillus notoginsengisoli]RHW43333.1 hypothetical protein D1B31_01295 [Neobacillus notoginsengisoli]